MAIRSQDWRLRTPHFRIETLGVALQGPSRGILILLRHIGLFEFENTQATTLNGCDKLCVGKEEYPELQDAFPGSKRRSAYHFWNPIFHAKVRNSGILQEVMGKSEFVFEVPGFRVRTSMPNMFT